MGQDLTWNSWSKSYHSLTKSKTASNLAPAALIESLMTFKRLCMINIKGQRSSAAAWGAQFGAEDTSQTLNSRFHTRINTSNTFSSARLWDEAGLSRMEFVFTGMRTNKEGKNSTSHGFLQSDWQCRPSVCSGGGRLDKQSSGAPGGSRRGGDED